MDKRFESMDKRFESMDKRFESMDKRFEAMDKRFEALINQMNKGFEEARKERKKIRTFLTKVSAVRGQQLESTILELLSDRLIKESINVGEFKKEYLVDKEGTIYVKDYITDIDIVIQDGKTILIEIKAKADNRDVLDLIKKGQLFKKQFNKDPDVLMLLCLEINQTNLEFAIKHGIKIIAGEIV
ncbi:MAG: hypothetical protein ACTSQJ_12960 [Promethearchaeota archaeon]